MPRNITGGSGHKAQRNSEGSKARNNRCLVDDLLDDYRDNAITTGVFVGRVLKRMGSGRMEVFFKDPLGDTHQMILPLRGGLRGKGKSSVWVDVDSIVMVAETGLAGMTHEIVAVFSEAHIARYKKVVPNADPRLFQRGGSSDSATAEEDGFEFETAAKEEEDINVDDI
jgi:hypothetical protein